MSKNGGIIGVSDHGGWAVLVTVGRDGTLLDRRRVELVGEGLPKLPHHSEGQGLPLDEAVELVERVRVSAERHSMPAIVAGSCGHLRKGDTKNTRHRHRDSVLR